jgi:hypothetical protein
MAARSFASRRRGSTDVSPPGRRRPGARRSREALPLGAMLSLAMASGCGGSEATRNRTFYHWSLGEEGRAFERPYPALDWPPGAEQPQFVGVSVLDGAVRFSRPRDWRLRQASDDPDEPYVHYVSPSAYAFAVYRRPDSPTDEWSSIRARFEADVAASSARIVGRAVPMAVARGQGFAYSIEREVDAAQQPLIARSREMLLRDDQLVALVQIVHQEKNFANVDAELLRVVESLHLY